MLYSAKEMYNLKEPTNRSHPILTTVTFSASVAVCCGVLQCVVVCCSVSQCVVVCCSVLQLLL